MPRANRISSPGLVWHVTHRCHQSQFLLRFARDRRRWRHWLFEARRRHGLCVLNYIATSNHVHLLVFDQGRGEIASSMQLIAGRVAQEYNQRKNRRGSFWEDRYHATAVQTDRHLLACMTYIDLNMVRAGAVSHPIEWDISGYAEIQHPFCRKGVIDFTRLCALINAESPVSAAQRLDSAVTENLGTSKKQRAWSRSVGVGDASFLRNLKNTLGPCAVHREVERDEQLLFLKESETAYETKNAKTGP